LGIWVVVGDSGDGGTRFFAGGGDEADRVEQCGDHFQHWSGEHDHTGAFRVGGADLRGAGGGDGIGDRGGFADGLESPWIIVGRFWSERLLFYICSPEVNARVAKLVDALCSGRSVRKDVLVRIQSRALGNPCK
jgi:hypothetical protein